MRSNTPGHYFEQAKTNLHELYSLVGEVVVVYPSFAKALRGYWGIAQGVAYTLNEIHGQFDSRDVRDKAFAQLDSEYNALLAALQQYRKGRDGTSPSIGGRLRKAFHLPGAVRE